jgi:hypothetical protein
MQMISAIDPSTTAYLRLPSNRHVNNTLPELQSKGGVYDMSSISIYWIRASTPPRGVPSILYEQKILASSSLTVVVGPLRRSRCND